LIETFKNANAKQVELRLWEFA